MSAIAVLVGLSSGLAWWILGGEGSDPVPEAREARVDGPPAEVRRRERTAPIARMDATPAPPPAPVEDPHDAETRAWIALDHRVRGFFGSPLEPQVPPDADPVAEDAAFQDALDERLAALEALEAELIEVAQDRGRPRRALEATVTLGELYADMGASVEQLPVPSHLGPRQAARQARENDARAAVHLDKARLVFDMAEASGAGADPGLAARVQAGRTAVSR